MLPVNPTSEDLALPCVNAQHTAWPTAHRPSRLRGEITSTLWWSWLGQLAHRAFQNEGWSSSPNHGWSTVERVLTAAQAAWDQALANGKSQVRVSESTSSEARWSLTSEPWKGLPNQRQQAAQVLRAMRGFHGTLRRPFDPLGRDPVHQQAQERCVERALDLLVRTFPGWDDAWFAQNGMNAHPAFVAVQRHQPAMLAAWLRHGLNPNLRSDGRTLLQEAASQGHEDLVKRLLDHGARPNERRWGERSALQHALALPTADVFDRLRAHGAEWPPCSWWINPDLANPAHRHAERWVARPTVLEVAVWSQPWAWQRWITDHPAAFAALDMTALGQRAHDLWSLEMSWSGNPGVGTGTVAFRLPSHEQDRLVQARQRQPVVMQEQVLRQALLDPTAPPAPHRDVGRRL